MRRIYKYELGRNVELPEGAEILKVALQNGFPMLWALVDTGKPMQLRSFVIYGTGQNISEDHKYVGTYFELDFVWHIFEVIND